MVDNYTHAKPKPIKSTKPTKLKGHFSGPTDQFTALYNAILASPDCIQVNYQPATRGESDENTWALTVEMKPTKRRKERGEKPYVDKSGDVYLFRSRKTIGRYKLGESTRTLKRVGEVNRVFEEDFERIHIIHTDDAYALEQALHKKYAAVKEEGEAEIFWFTDEQVDEIRAL